MTDKGFRKEDKGFRKEYNLFMKYKNGKQKLINEFKSNKDIKSIAFGVFNLLIDSKTKDIEKIGTKFFKDYPEYNPDNKDQRKITRDAFEMLVNRIEFFVLNEIQKIKRHNLYLPELQTLFKNFRKLGGDPHKLGNTVYSPYQNFCDKIAISKYFNDDIEKIGEYYDIDCSNEYVSSKFLKEIKKLAEEIEKKHNYHYPKYDTIIKKLIVISTDPKFNVFISDKNGNTIEKFLEIVALDVYDAPNEYYKLIDQLLENIIYSLERTRNNILK